MIPRKLREMGYETEIESEKKVVYAQKSLEYAIKLLKKGKGVVKEDRYGNPLPMGEIELEEMLKIIRERAKK